MFEILSAAEMKNAEAAAIEQGIAGLQLMTAAGTAAAEAIISRFKQGPVLVLCGPGNNGGDGFIVAQHLKKAGWPVRVACMVKSAALKNDAAAAAKKWEGPVEGLNSNLSVHQTNLIVDAVFGTGFDRAHASHAGHALEPELKILFDKIRSRKIPVAAIDVPTGLNALTGAVDPAALKADVTVTFCRKKIGQLLLPGRNYCGDIIVTDIGITDAMVALAGAACLENHPLLWLKDIPVPDAESHKYTRGHAVVYGGEKRTGAACLAAAAAQKIGAGLVTIASPAKAWTVYSSYRASLLVDECNNTDEFKTILRDERKNAILLGPGAGTDDRLRQAVEAALSLNKSGVLDADVFSAYHNSQTHIGAKDLFAKLSPKFVLTPHEGEFEKLFGNVEGSKPERALKAAKTANAIVVLKGADTVIAAPDGACVINTNAPPALATAGSGDALAGFITGLIAQGMAPFKAACAAVWLQGESARIHGRCLTAEDIISGLPQALNALFGYTPIAGKI